jgi:23S rRNA pseudouridine1911/1915/1917 synthase
MSHANGGLENSVKIIYEDDDTLVINKPAGLIVHSDGRTEEPSVAEWVLKNYPALKDVGEQWLSPQGELIPRPGIVHRLDRTTSGAMAIAKTQEAYAFLKEQFQNRTVEKRYDALVYGHPKEDFGTIEAEIGRTKKKPRKWIANFAHGKKRAAVTTWRVFKRYTDKETGENITHLEASPKTGRTHQIRVHLKAIHHPIVCDRIYAPKKPCLLGLARPALHAHFLILTLQNGKCMTFQAPLPDDMQNALFQLKGE